ncbi:Paired amphipathic helix protein sin3-like [Thalictrum thalictroides]|uniref:Paired amphipathic helix protein sin3-like n=1 Tax=Thalictrum thalictroides TaxID=46969 RepID=A0A7J6VEE2_THATH|nr:Paired amphipathic helix protein sin3-like [Thalictrum thalictroides]
MESYISAMMLLKRPVDPSGRKHCAKSEGKGQVVKVTSNDVQAYLNEVKDRFKDKKEDYQHFLYVIKGFKANSFDTPGVMLMIKKMFKEHPDLIVGFNRFLPKGYEIKLPKKPCQKKTFGFGEALSFVNKVEARTKNNPFIYKSFLVLLNMYRKDKKSITELNNEVAALFHDYPDLLDEFKQYSPRHYAKSTILHGPPKNSAILSPDYEKAMLKVEWGKRFFNNIHCLHKDKSYHKNGENLVEEQTKKFQKLSICSPNDDKKLLESVHSQEFYELVKEKLHNFDDYQKFLKCLSIYNNEPISRSEMQSLIGDLLANPNLRDGFCDFLKRTGKTGDAPKPLMIQRNHEMDKDEERQRFDSNMGTTGHRVPFPSNGKSIENLMAELDLSSSEYCFPSYRLLPDYHIIPPASQRPELGTQVVDDCWVSVTSGSEDFSFKNLPKNHNEDGLFHYEDNKNHLMGMQNS